MYQGFWSSLPRPIIALSPMDGVTDAPYRRLQKRVGQPDVVFTEFTSAEGVAHSASRLLRDFLFVDEERPVVAQIFGKEPAAFRTTALVLCYLGFDGIDINMGCPAKNVSQHGSGAALIRTPDTAQALIRATQAGVQDWVNGRTLAETELKDRIVAPILERHHRLAEKYRQRTPIPVSVKTRIGYDVECVADWIPQLLEMEPAALSVHGRLLKQLYSGAANWEAIAKVVALARGTGTLVLGNGDITSVAVAEQRVRESGVDGILVGRATFGNPWILRDLIHWRNHVPLPPKECLQDRLQLAIEHAKLFEQTFPDEGFLAMRKHLGWYVRDFPDASAMRTLLVRANSSAEVEAILAPLVHHPTDDTASQSAPPAS